MTKRQHLWARKRFMPRAVLLACKLESVRTVVKAQKSSGVEALLSDAVRLQF